jgi:hypothetical protein
MGRRHEAKRPRDGDGSALKGYLTGQQLTRSLFLTGRDDPDGRHVYAVDVHYFADELSDLGKGAAPPAALYRDGEQVLRSDLPATFPVPGGEIQVATSLFGLTRMHLVTDDGERMLRPHRDSAEGLRARFGRRFPTASRVLGVAAVVVLLLALAAAVPQALEWVTRIDLVGDAVGTFVSPLQLPAWANTALAVSGVLAALERALSLRHHWLIDLDTWWLGD